MAASHNAMEEGGQAQTPKPSSRGLMPEVWSTQAWKLLPLVFIYVASVAVLLPAKPDIMTDFFASRRAGHSVTCGNYSQEPEPEPEYCRDAHSDAVWWSSFSDFVSHSIITFLLAPLIGRWSDRYGRRPFIAVFLMVASVPPFILAAHINYGLSLYYYFPAQAFAGFNALLSLATAYVSDLVSAQHRASAIGLIMAAFSVGLLFGPLMGGFLGTVVASALSVVGTSLALLLLIFTVPESLSQASKEGAKVKQRKESRWAQAPWNCLRILGRSDLFVRLTICIGIIGFVSLGLMEVLAQYLQLKLDYMKMDLAVIITVAGGVGLLTQTVVLRLLMNYLGETRILILGCLSRIAEQMVLCIALDRATVTVGVVIGSLAHLTMPAISSLISKNSEQYEQGTAQGALYGALALSQGFGPLAFAYLFQLGTRSDSPWTYFPGAPYLFGSILMLICTYVACTIDRKSADRGRQEQDSHNTLRDELHPHDEEAMFALKHSQDLVTAGSISLVQRQPSTLNPLGTNASSSSLEVQTTQNRGYLDQSLPISGSVDSRLPRKQWPL